MNDEGSGSQLAGSDKCYELTESESEESQRVDAEESKDPTQMWLVGLTHEPIAKEPVVTASFVTEMKQVQDHIKSDIQPSPVLKAEGDTEDRRNNQIQTQLAAERQRQLRQQNN